MGNDRNRSIRSLITFTLATRSKFDRPPNPLGSPAIHSTMVFPSIEVGPVALRPTLSRGLPFLGTKLVRETTAPLLRLPRSRPTVSPLTLIWSLCRIFPMSNGTSAKLRLTASNHTITPFHGRSGLLSTTMRNRNGVPSTRPTSRFRITRQRCRHSEDCVPVNQWRARIASVLQSWSRILAAPAVTCDFRVGAPSCLRDATPPSPGTEQTS